MNSSVLALIGDIGGPELLLIFVLVLLLFGGKSLPDFARGLARSIREFKKATSGVEEEIKRAMEEPPPPRRSLPPPPPPVSDHGFDHGGQPAAHDSYHDYSHHDYHAGEHPAGPSGHEVDSSIPPAPPAASEPATAGDVPAPSETVTPQADHATSQGSALPAPAPASSGESVPGPSKAP